MSSASPVEFHPYEPAFAADPYRVYARLRETSPVFHSPEVGTTLFTRYDHIRAILIDGRFGRSLEHVSTPEELERQRTAETWRRLPAYSRYVRVNLLEKEGADHTRIRRLVSAALDPRRIRKLRGQVQTVVDELLQDIVPRGRMNFVEELAVPLPVHMISELLGWPASERHRLRPWSAQIVRLYEHDYTEEDEARAEAAAGEFAGMISELADARKQEPRDDLISALVSIVDGGERLTRDELIATCMLLLNAGHEATVNAAGNGLLALLRNPRELARLRAEPALLTSAIEEIIRYDAPLQLFHRFALEDLEFAGFSFRKGETLGLLYGSGNRDPNAFERADEFDIARSPNRHLGFGAGAHFCLGAPLARLELEVLFGTMFRQFSVLQLAEEPVHRTGLVFRGLKELQLQW
jgi:cytochrome P450